MNIKEEEVLKLRAMLESYKQKNGTVAKGFVESLNSHDTTGCFGCTHSCWSHCDGNNGVCWEIDHR
jgi:hypothetical protein